MGLPPKGPIPKGAVLTAKKPSPNRTPATATRDARAQQEKDQAATRLQAVRRGSVARRGSHAAAAEAEAKAAEAAVAATKMQAIRRGSGSRRQQQRQRQEKDQAAVRLQAVRRGSVARRDAAVSTTAPASSVKGPLRIIEEALAANAGRVIDLFREWDGDGDGKVSKQELRRAVAALGFDVPDEDADALFDTFDPDGSGSIEYAELKRALKRRAAPPPPPPQPRPVRSPTRPVAEGRQLGDRTAGKQPAPRLAPSGGGGGAAAAARAAAEAYAGAAPADNAWAAQELISRSAKFSSAFVRAHVQLEAQLLLAVDGVQLAPSVRHLVITPRCSSRRRCVPITYGCSLHHLWLQVCAAWSQPVQLYCAACVVDGYGTVVPEAAEVRPRKASTMRLQPRPCGYSLACGLDHAVTASTMRLQPSPHMQ